MVNLSECKFGDRLRTRDGEMVVFLGAEDYHGLDGVLHKIYYCAMAVGERFALMEYYDGERGNNDALPEIVCRWEKEQDEPHEANIKGIECPNYLNKVYKLN